MLRPQPLYTDLSLQPSEQLAIDELAVSQSITNILRTFRGERDLGFYPEFGSNHHDQLHQPLDDEMGFEVMFGVRNAIKDFEPRATVDRGSTGYTIDEAENVLIANVTYRILGLPGTRFYDLVLGNYHDILRR